jgi:hypothetical protein
MTVDASDAPRGWDRSTALTPPAAARSRARTWWKPHVERYSRAKKRDPDTVRRAAWGTSRSRALAGGAIAVLLRDEERRRLFEVHQRMTMLLTGLTRHAPSLTFTEEVVSRLPEQTSSLPRRLWTFLWAPRVVRWNLASALALSVVLATTPRDLAKICRRDGGRPAASGSPSPVISTGGGRTNLSVG